MLGGELRIAVDHHPRFPAAQILQLIAARAGLAMPRRRGMPEIVEPEVRNACFVTRRAPRAVGQFPRDRFAAKRALPTTDPSSNPPQPHGSEGANGRELCTDAQLTDGDWHFPQGLSPGEIDALREILQTVDPARGQELLDELAGRLKTGKITSPIRYCAALVKRLNEGKFTPELGIRVAEARAQQRQDLDRRNAGANMNPGALQTPMERLPEELRSPLERMRKHVLQEADESQGDIGQQQDDG